MSIVAHIILKVNTIYAWFLDFWQKCAILSKNAPRKVEHLVVLSRIKESGELLCGLIRCRES